MPDDSTAERQGRGGGNRRVERHAGNAEAGALETGIRLHVGAVIRSRLNAVRHGRTVMAISTSGRSRENAQASVVAGMYWNPFLGHVQRNGPKPTHDARDNRSGGVGIAGRLLICSALRGVARPEPPPLPITTEADGRRDVLREVGGTLVPTVAPPKTAMSPRNNAAVLAAGRGKRATMHGRGRRT